MKVLFILHYPPPVHGSSIVGSLIKESRLINESFDCRYINLGISASVEEIGKNPAGKLGRYLRLLWRVMRTLLFFRPDICYLTISSKGTGFYKDALIVLIVRVFGVKRVYHFHNKGVSTRQGKVLDNLLYRIVFKNADVILLSKQLYPDVQKYVTEDRVQYCPNGVPEMDGGISNAKRDHIEPAPEILFLSHLIASKGVFILIDSLKIVHENDHTFHCTIIGGEGDVTEKQLEESIEKFGLTGFVKVVGKKYGGEKETAFVAADIFVHPTFNDCQPLVILEAMQHSVPVVSTFEGAIPDMVEDGVSGFLVSQRDAQSLANKLEVLIKDSELRKRMGSAGRLRYETIFTIDKFENRMVEILKSTAGA